LLLGRDCGKGGKKTSKKSGGGDGSAAPKTLANTDGFAARLASSAPGAAAFEHSKTGKSGCAGSVGSAGTAIAAFGAVAEPVLPKKRAALALLT
jgi:hypothetical protein